MTIALTGCDIKEEIEVFNASKNLHDSKDRVTARLSSDVIQAFLFFLAQKQNRLHSIDFLENDTAENLSTLNTSHIEKILHFSNRIISITSNEDAVNISISTNNLEKVSKNIKDLDLKNEMVMKYIRLGVTSYCVHDLFNISKTKFVHLRKMYNISESSHGRYKYDLVDNAREEYKKITQNLRPEEINNIEIFLRISEEQNIPLNTVWWSVRVNKQKEIIQAKGYRNVK